MMNICEQAYRYLQTYTFGSSDFTETIVSSMSSFSTNGFGMKVISAC